MVFYKLETNKNIFKKTDITEIIIVFDNNLGGYSNWLIV